jgi:hypothetical protein
MILSIANHLQSTQKTTGINMILGGYDLPIQNVDMVPSKASYVRDLMAGATDELIIKIAGDLGLAIPTTTGAAVSDFKQYLAAGGLGACEDDFNRALKSIDADPAQAISSANALLESVFKELLGRFDQPFNDTDTVLKLAKATFNALDLSPENEADDAVRQVMSGLTSIANGIASIRNNFSAAHGKTESQRKVALGSRHARLMIGAASLLSHFLLETYAERKIAAKSDS